MRITTKQAALLALLAREHGATIKEMVELTGWKPNTVHSALTTARASGRDIITLNDGAIRRYKFLSADPTGREPLSSGT